MLIISFKILYFYKLIYFHIEINNTQKIKKDNFRLCIVDINLKNHTKN